MKNNILKTVIKSVVAAIVVAFVVVVLLRKSIFTPGSFFYELYEEDVAGEILVRLVKTLVIVAIGVVIIWAARLLVLWGDKSSNNTTKTALLLIGNILKYVSGIAVVLCSLAAWGIDVSVIVTGAGVITLVIGLGCQSMVADVVAGIFILFEGDFKVGDIVVINGWRGTVQQIGIRRTRIIDAVGNVNIVNNSSISNIINNTQELSIAVCDVGIEYNESIERVEAILRNNLDAIKAHVPAIVEGPFYKGVAELGASSVVIKLVAKCKEEDKFQTERDLNREIKLLFDKENINIPFDQIVLNYRDEDEVLTEASRKEKLAAQKFIAEQRELSRGMEEQDAR